MTEEAWLHRCGDGIYTVMMRDEATCSNCNAALKTCCSDLRQKVLIKRYI